MTSQTLGLVGLGHVGRALHGALAPRFRLLCHDPLLADSVPLATLARDCAAVFVCVPTPAAPGGGADTSIVRQVVAELACATPSPVVVIRSTVPPGTTQALAARHAPLPVVACPEFLREHAAAADLADATRIVVGLPAGAAPSVLAPLAPVWPVLSPKAHLVVTDAATAELAKYATNAFLALKVTFANQLADACAAQGVDYAAFARVLALDPRIGASHLAVPGHDGQRGFGGACLPKDMAALLALAGPQLPLLEEAVRWNAVVRGGDR